MFPARLTQTLLRSLDRVALRTGWRDQRSLHTITGERGEEEAYFHLRNNGYTIVARNYRSHRCKGELDIVAWDRGTLCFVEVKTRTAKDFAPAESAVDPEKREDLRRIAGEYLRHIPGVSTRLASGEATALPPTRFDLVSVYLLPGEPPTFELRKSAFTW
ncbi:MAG: YraN family protein [Acidobacteriaceae bacterium]